MKRAIITLLALCGAFFAQADEAPWQKTLGKVKDLSGDTGIMSFLKKEAPAYITGNYAEKDRPAKTPRSANNVGYYDNEGKWHGGYFDDSGTFVAGHEVHTLFNMPYGVGQMIMIPLCLILIYLAVVKGFEPLLLLPIAFGMFLINLPGAHDIVWGKYASGVALTQEQFVEANIVLPKNWIFPQKKLSISTCFLKKPYFEYLNSNILTNTPLEEFHTQPSHSSITFHHAP